MKTQLHTLRLWTRNGYRDDFRLRTKLIFSIFCSLFSVFSLAQTYQYEWAKNGGGGLSGSDSVFNEREDETIRDIVVDADNNYYFLANLQGGTINYEGISFTHYGRN